MIEEHEFKQLSPSVKKMFVAFLSDNSVTETKDQILLCHQILKNLNRDNTPAIWAYCHYQLGYDLVGQAFPNNPDLLDKAITHLELALSVYLDTNNPKQVADVCSLLCHSYAERIHGSQQENIERSISYGIQARDNYSPLTSPDDWIAIQIFLANVYIKNHYGNRIENIELALKCGQSALEILLKTIDDPTYKNVDAAKHKLVSIHGQIAQIYIQRLIGDRDDNLKRAYKHIQVALPQISQEEEPLLWITLVGNLAAIYLEDNQGNQIESERLAIRYATEALQVAETINVPHKQVEILMLLVRSYSIRQFGEVVTNIEKAISYGKRALSFSTRDGYPIIWANLHFRIAELYRRRVVGNKIENLFQAINHANKALEIYDRQTFPSLWAKTHSELGRIYKILASNTCKDEDFEAALSHFQQALLIFTLPDHSQSYFHIQISIGDLYFQYAQKCQQKQYHEKGLTVFQHLFTQYDVAPPLEWAKLNFLYGQALLTNFTNESDGSSEKIAKHYKEAIQLFTPHKDPIVYRNVASWLARYHQEREEWDTSVDYYLQAIKAGRILYQTSFIFQSKAEALASLQEINYEAVTAMLMCDEPPLESLVSVLEHSRARFLSQAIDRQRVDVNRLQETDKELYWEYIRALQKINYLSYVEKESLEIEHLVSIQGNRSIIDDYELAYTDFESVAGRIRRLPGFENFLDTDTTIEDVVSVVTVERPLVYLSVSSSIGQTVILRRDDQNKIRIDYLWLEEINLDALNLLYYGLSLKEQGLFLQDKTAFGTDEFINKTNRSYFGIMRWLHYGFANPNTQERKNLILLARTSLKSHVRWLEKIMAPIVHHLLERVAVNQATLIPGGLLSMLPLAAAQLTNEGQNIHVIDKVSLSFAPNAKSIAVRKQEMTTIDHSSRLLLVHEPTNDHVKKLKNAYGEVQQAQLYWGKRPLTLVEGKNATRKYLIEAMPEYDVIHFTGHAFADLDNPEKSGLILAKDEVLTVQQIHALRLTARLVILSACRTNVSGTQLINEVVSLSTAFIEAGAAGVIASLWLVEDLATSLLTSKFYHYWLEELFEPSEALRLAQLWLRDVSAQELANRFGEERMSLKGNRLTLEEASEYWRRFAAEEPESKPFAHPYYWAAFTFTGA